MVSLEKVRNAQKILDEALKEVVNAVCKDADKELSGVNVVSENIVVVCLSNLFTNNLSPAMYIQSCQINAVKNATKNIKNFDDLINKLSEMKTTKKVKVGSETIFLNDVTIEAINSVLLQL